MSKSRMGKSPSSATREKLSKINKGMIQSSTVIEAVIESNKKRVWTKEQRELLSKRRKEMWAKRKAASE